MARVSVIGLGNMGRALARAFIAKNHSVTVWNRTQSAVSGLNAHIAASPAAAFAVSDMTVICVSDNDVVRSLLEDADVRAAVKGKTVVNLNTSTPDDAEQLSAIFVECGAAYLDGTIPAFPDQIGATDVGVVVAGPAAVWERHRELLMALGGETWYAGESIAAPAALDMAMAISFYHAAMGAFVEASKFALIHGVYVGNIRRTVPALLTVMQQQFSGALDAMERDSFLTDQATVDVHLGAVQMAVQVLAESFPNRNLYCENVAKDLQNASAAGLGASSMAAISKVL